MAMVQMRKLRQRGVKQLCIGMIYTRPTLSAGPPVASFILSHVCVTHLPGHFSQNEDRKVQMGRSLRSNVPQKQLAAGQEKAGTTLLANPLRSRWSQEAGACVAV